MKKTALLFILMFCVVVAGGQTRPSYLQLKDTPTITVDSYGRTLAAITTADAIGGTLLFASGTFTISADTTISSPVFIAKGATITVSSGKRVTFAGKVDAGEYKIFDIDTALAGDRAATFPVYLAGNATAKPEWFGGQTANTISDILHVDDVSPFFECAYRSLAGSYENYVTGGTTHKRNVDCTGNIELAAGYYRCDETLHMGRLATAGAFIYFNNGIGILGKGSAASFLVRTDLDSTDPVLDISYGSAEKRIFRDFKVTCYNPADASPFNSKASAMILSVVCDSQAIQSIWVSGAQYDTGTHFRGTGFLFSNCIDTYVSDCFVEYCGHGMSFASTRASVSDSEIYVSLYSGITFGVPLSDYGFPQPASGNSSVTITNSKLITTHRYGIYCMTPNNSLSMSNTVIDGRYIEVFPAVTVQNDMCFINTGSSLFGRWDGIDVVGFSRSVIIATGTGSIGGPLNEPLILTNSFFKDQDGSWDVSGVFNTVGAPSSQHNLSLDNLYFSNVRNTLVYAPVLNSFHADKIYVKECFGKADGGSTATALFTFGTTATATLSNIFLDNSSSSTVLDQLLYHATGTLLLNNITCTPDTTDGAMGSGTFLKYSTTNY